MNPYFTEIESKDRFYILNQSCIAEVYVEKRENLKNIETWCVRLKIVDGTEHIIGDFVSYDDAKNAAQTVVAHPGESFETQMEGGENPMLRILLVRGEHPDKSFLQAFDAEFNKVELVESHEGTEVLCFEVNVETGTLSKPSQVRLISMNNETRKVTLEFTY